MEFTHRNYSQLSCKIVGAGSVVRTRARASEKNFCTSFSSVAQDAKLYRWLAAILEQKNKQNIHARRELLMNCELQTPSRASAD